MLAVERLQQIQDPVARLAVEVARRFVAQQQRRVRDNSAGNTDPLLLAAGELPWKMFRALQKSDHGQRRLHMVPSLGFG